MPATMPAFFLFALVAGFTPGPNNLMLATSGVNFGLRRTMPHAAGVIIGFPLLFAAVGAGLGTLFTQLPWLHTALTVLGSIYLLWLAWKIAFAPATVGTKEGARPLTFLQAAAFQWVNPKAWMMVITSISVYTVPGEGYAWRLALMTGISLLVSAGSTSTWALFGVSIRRVFEHRPRLLRAFNVTMGVLLVLSLVPMLFTGKAVA